MKKIQEIFGEISQHNPPSYETIYQNYFYKSSDKLAKAYSINKDFFAKKIVLNDANKYYGIDKSLLKNIEKFKGNFQKLWFMNCADFNPTIYHSGYTFNEQMHDLHKYLSRTKSIDSPTFFISKNLFDLSYYHFKHLYENEINTFNNMLDNNHKVWIYNINSVKWGVPKNYSYRCQNLAGKICKLAFREFLTKELKIKPKEKYTVSFVPIDTISLISDI